jgi:CRP/FNR family transcriptional regulator
MLNQDQTQRLFQLYPVLARLEPKLLDHALLDARLITLKTGARVFNELQPCNAFPFILSGHIRVFKQAENGRELSLYNVREGDACVVTAGCLLGDKPYNASGQVKAQSSLVMLPAPAFDRLLSNKTFREFIFSLFSQRILGLMQLVEEVAFHKLDRRLAGLLLRRGGKIKASHQELADELGTVREMVTRLLNSFADSGLLNLGRGRISLLDKKALEAIARD